MWQNAHDTYLESRILSVDPIELIGMLYQAATRAVGDARRHLADGDIAARARSITRASAVVIELATSLDHERGGQISANLARLYDYMLRRLTEANHQQSDGPLGEVLGLLRTLSEGWDGVQAQGVAAPAARREDPLPQPSAPKPAATNGGSWEQPAAQQSSAAYGGAWEQPAAQEPAATFGNSWEPPSSQEPEGSYGNVWGQPVTQEPAATFGSAWEQPAVQALAAAYEKFPAQPASPEPAASYGNSWAHLASQEPPANYSPRDWSL